MNTQAVLDKVLENIDAVIAQSSPVGVSLWQEFIELHPADIALFLGDLDRVQAQALFTRFSPSLKLGVFAHLSYSMKVFCLSFLNDHDRAYLLSSLPLDELTDFFDELSDEELKKYLKVLHKKDREQVLSLMRFDPESAGGLMHTDVLTLMQDFTIEKSIQILQRLQPRRELHHQIYVTNQDNELVGNINLEDLLLKNPKTRLSSILRKNELVVKAAEDRESVAHKMVHYDLMTVPVVGEGMVFLGAIPSSTLVEIIEQEAAEDVYKISALTPIKHTYFETPFMNLFSQRASILVALLLVQTFSTIIIGRYQSLLGDFLIIFISMITSTGGNTSSQTSALVIQGVNSGEITDINIGRFLRREFLMALAIGLSLGVVSFVRVYITHAGNVWGNLVVSLSLAVIVVVSVMLGSLIPFILNKFDLDPALSAGPFLATLMDVLGLLIYCGISQLILGT